MLSRPALDNLKNLSRQCSITHLLSLILANFIMWGILFSSNRKKCRLYPLQSSLIVGIETFKKIPSICIRSEAALVGSSYLFRYFSSAIITASNWVWPSCSPQHLKDFLLLWYATHPLCLTRSFAAYLKKKCEFREHCWNDNWFPYRDVQESLYHRKRCVVQIKLFYCSSVS